MLTSLYLENFRAFGAATTIPLAPITLLFGENSSGKTSVLHALTLLKQTQEAENKQAALVSRGLVDLGSFEEYIFDHDTDRELTIGLASKPVRSEVAERQRQRIVHWTRGEACVSALSWSFRRDEGTGNVRLSQVAMRIPETMREYAVYEHDPRAEAAPVMRASQVAWPAKLSRLQLSKEEVSAAAAALDKAKPALIKALDEFLERRQRSRERMLGAETPSRTEDLLRSADELRKRIETKFDSETLARDIETSWSEVEWCRHALHLQPDIASIGPLRRLSLGTLIGLVDSRTRAALVEHPCLQGAFILADGANSALWALDRLVPIGPFRQPAARVYSYSGTAPGTVGRGGELVPELLHQDMSAVDRVNQWFQRFEIRYQLRLKKLGGKTRSDIFELRLRDKARGGNVEVAFNDVGFGISQMLPIIVQSVASEKKIITIEQPEVHIHPRLQSEIGDLLVETMQKNGHQFLVETHSEHLILRLRKLVRENKLTPADLCVLHVARGKQGAEVQRIHVGEDGTFLDEWPGGFFPERLRELT